MTKVSLWMSFIDTLRILRSAKVSVPAMTSAINVSKVVMMIV